MKTDHGDDKYQRECRRLAVLQFVAALLLVLWAFFWILRFPPNDVGTWIWFALLCVASFAWMPWFRSPWRPERASGVLLDLGRHDVSSSVVGALVFVFAAGLQFWPDAYDSPMERVAIGTTWMFVAARQFFIGLRRTLITEQGIFFRNNLFNWERFESYIWAGKNGGTLKLCLKENPASRSWHFGFRQSPLKLTIPITHKEAVASLLEKYLSATKQMAP